MAKDATIPAVRLPRAVRDEINARAKAAGLGVSEWLRWLIGQELRNTTAQSPKSVVARKPRSAKELQSSATAVDS